MPIVVYCPECQSRYQLNADLRGRRMRCPNNACRTTFIVQEATGGPPSDPNNGPRIANARGEMVVPLSASDPVRRGTPEPVEELDWRNVPPPVQGPSPPQGKSAIRKPQSAIDRPVLGTPAVVSRSVPPPSRSAFVADDPEPPRRGRWKLLALVVLCLGLLVGGGWAVYTRLAQAEDNLRTDAEKDYLGGTYRGATQKYRELADRFGRSPHAAEYRFLTGLSAVREALGRTPPESAEAIQQADGFLDQFGRDPLLKDRREEFGRSLWSFATEMTAAAESAIRSPELDSVKPLVEHGRKAVGLARRVPARDARPDELARRLDRVETSLTAALERKRHLTETLALFSQPKPDLRAIRGVIQRYGLGNDPAIIAALDKYKKTWSQVAYEPLDRPPISVSPSDGPPGLLLEPSDLRNVRSAIRNPLSDLVLAVSRGLLYALDGADGRRLWAARVGLDAGELPVRILARGDEPELVVVASTNPPGLTARDARTGAVRWHQPLEEPVLGRPVLAAGRLFAATAGPEGAVYDLDSRTGLLHGRFVAHQQLAGGAAFDTAAGRLFVPAYGQYVYVFTYETGSSPRCEGWLATDHAPGSLRGEPIVISGADGVVMSRYLVLGEADGLAAMKLRAFQLLPRSPTDAAPPAEMRLPGWSWFPPYYDTEKLALVTDAGAIGLFGIRQDGNADPPLFPLLGKTLSTFQSATGALRRPARAQLVHAEEYGFWVLAGGTLQHYRLGLDRRTGLRLTPVWGPGVALGAPLHAAQVSADRSTLFLVTQTESPSTNWATAVAARNGEIRWRRPLGLSPCGDPVSLGGAVLVLDTAGGLYRFDPSHHPSDPPSTWQSAGETLSKPLSVLLGEPFLIRAADGQSAYAFLCRPAEAGEYQLVVRRVPADGPANTLAVNLPSPPAGPPALGPNAAVLPLMNGTLYRVALDFEAPPSRAEPGPNWPHTRHPPRSKGTRSALGRGRVSGLGRWPADEALTLAHRHGLQTRRGAIAGVGPRAAGAPVRLPDTDGTPTGAVADLGGTLTLFRGANPQRVRSWKLGGVVTAGPWVIGDRLAVVVDRHKLVWLDPAQEAPLWTATIDGDGVEAAPQLVEGRLVVADLAGRFLGLDPATGRSLGGGYRHPAEVAPASASVPFGPGRLFAPLTDGTVLLLRLSDLERPATAGR